MANPINPKTQQPWTDQEMAYFRTIAEQQKAGTYNQTAHDAYLTSIAKPNSQTGAPQWLQNADPYQVNGGFQEINDAAQRDAMRQAADMARKVLDFQKGNATGWVDGRATEEEQRRQDEIRSNPLNAALYEQERRGFRSGTGNEDPLMYQKGEGDKAFTPPAALPPTAPSGGAPTKNAPAAGGGGTGTTHTNTAPAWQQATASASSREKAFQASGLPNTDAGRIQFAGLVAGRPERVSYGQSYWENPGEKGTPSFDTRMNTMNKQEAASHAAPTLDLSRLRGLRGLEDGGAVDIPGYEGGGKFYGFNTPQEAMAFRDAMAPHVAEFQAAAPENTMDRFANTLRYINAARAPRTLTGQNDFGNKDVWNALVAKTEAENATRDYQRDPLRYGVPREQLPSGDGDYMDYLKAQGEAQSTGGYEDGGGLTLGGAPHWIVDPMGKPIAALTEDGKKEQVKGKGGVEVVPLDPKRNAAYKARKAAVPGKATGGSLQMRASRTRPGSASGNRKATLSGRTTLSDEVNARTTGAADGRSGNGKTNNGRPRYPGNPLQAGVTDGDAAGVRRVVRGPMPVWTGQPVRPWAGQPPLMPTQQPVRAISDPNGIQRRTGIGDLNNDGKVNSTDLLINSKTPQRPFPSIGKMPVIGTKEFSPSVPAINIFRAASGAQMPIDTPLTRGPMGVGTTTLPVREPTGAVMPYRPVPGAAPAVTPTFTVPGHAYGMIDPKAYGGLGGASNSFVSSGKGTHQDFQDIMNGKRPYTAQTVTHTQRQTDFMNGQPTSAPVAPVAPAIPIAAPVGGFDASGGNRVIGNETAPTARYGFDKSAPIDIAAQGATRGVKGMPGIQVAQPWKQAPRALMARGTFGNQLLQSYWNATGAAPSDLADRGRAAMPGQAGAQRAFV